MAELASSLDPATGQVTFGSPLPVSAEVGGAIQAELADRGIDFVGGATITSIGPGDRAVRLADGSAIEADLILAVPLHVAPSAVVASGFTESGRSQADAAQYEGAGVCYIEFGRGAVGRIDVNFLGGPSVPAALQMPSRELRAEKVGFSVSRRARWFGLAN